jgi:hypothetical protein
MELQVVKKSEEAMSVGYACTCGCKPRVTYERGASSVDDTCCCGTHFVVAPDAGSQVEPQPGLRTEVQGFMSAWGEPLEAAWAIGPEKH